jgi:succinate dehydrogenase / fumarate reductase cytochrome b subunit
VSRDATSGGDAAAPPLDPEAIRAQPGPVLRKAPGPAAWVDVRHRALGHWAFSLNRVTALGLVFYLYVHLAVLTLLLGGESAWTGFLRVATTPVFLGLDVVLLFGLLFHGLNGLRVALVGTGIAPTRQRSLFWSLTVIGAIMLVGATLHIVGSG